MATHPEIPIELLQSPSFQLERIRRRTRDEVDKALGKYDTTMREFWVLTCLVSSTAKSQSALSHLLAIDASDMVRLLDGLEELGWAKRARDPKDRRKQIVTATKKGKNIQKELLDVVSKAESLALEESTSKQRKNLRKLATAIMSTEED